MSSPARPVIRHSWLLALPVALVAACDGGGGSAGPLATSSRPVEVRVEDPRGDTFGTELSAGLVQPDIVALRIVQQSDELVVIVEFAEPVEPDFDSPNAAPGLIDLDTDRNPATGLPGAADAFRPPGTGTAGLGVDVGVAVAPDGRVTVFDLRTGGERTLVADYAPRAITVRLPYAWIGGDGDVNLAAVFGTVPEPTDVAPNSGHVAVQAGGVVGAGGAMKAAGEVGGWTGWNPR